MRYILAVIFLFSIGCSHVGASNMADVELRAKAMIASIADKNEPGISVAIMSHSKIIFSEHRGMARLDQLEPINGKTVFHAASISKQFTAFAILLLESEGRLDIDDSIYQYLPEMELKNQYPITIGHLLDHMSGIREVHTLNKMVTSAPDSVLSKKRFEQILEAQNRLNFKPGSKVEYSNSGYFLLARIVENVSEKPFNEFMHERVFSPLNMNNSQFMAHYSDTVAGLANSYYSQPDTFAKAVYISDIDGSTGLKTNATDLVKWADNFTQQKVGNDHVFKQMAARAFALDGSASTFAKGREQRLYKGVDTWSHGGRDAGYRAFLLHIPKHQMAIAVLSNRSDFDSAKLAFELVDLFLEPYLISATDSKKEDNTMPSNLDTFVGEYELFRGLIFSVQLIDGKLSFAPLNSSNLTPLSRLSADEFLLDPTADIRLKFNRDEQNKVYSLDYQIGLHGSLTAPKIVLEPFISPVLAEYLGLYYSKELQLAVEVALVDDVLQLRTLTSTPVSLTQYQTDTFHRPGSAFQQVRFNRNEQQKVVSLLASGSLANDVLFERLNPN